MSIKEIKEKIKSVNDLYIKPIKDIDKNKNILISIIIILVGIASFGLGRLSNTNTTIGEVKVYTETLEVSSSTTKTIVASKNGTKYHYSWCSGAKSISEANKITFNTKEEAEKAGYTLAGNCKEL